MATVHINLKGIEIDGEKKISYISVTDPDGKPDYCTRCYIGAKNKCPDTCPFYEFRESK